MCLFPRPGTSILNAAGSRRMIIFGLTLSSGIPPGRSLRVGPRIVLMGRILVYGLVNFMMSGPSPAGSVMGVLPLIGMLNRLLVILMAPFRSIGVGMLPRSLGAGNVLMPTPLMGSVMWMLLNSSCF